MIIRSVARFDSSLPEDLVEDGEGNFLQPPGKSVADAITEILRTIGCDVYYGPEP